MITQLADIREMRPKLVNKIPLLEYELYVVSNPTSVEVEDCQRKHDL